jgi:hypothetical protein
MVGEFFLGEAHDQRLVEIEVSRVVSQFRKLKVFVSSSRSPLGPATASRRRLFQMFGLLDERVGRPALAPRAGREPMALHHGYLMRRFVIEVMYDLIDA